MRDLLPEEIRNVPRYEGSVDILAAIHKNAFLFGVSMQINKQKTVLRFNDRLLGIVDLRTANFIVTVPYSVEVIA